MSQSLQKREVETIDRSSQQSILKGLFKKSGSQIINEILDLKDPKGFVRSLSEVDFYWLMKKIGEDDALPFLELAKVSQWVYVLDLEIWVRDRIDNNKLCQWFNRLLQVNPERFVKMLMTEEGELLASFFAYRNLESIEVTRDETYDVPDDFVTLDGTIYFKPHDSEHLDMLIKMLKYMAMFDFQRYFSFMTNYKGILPAEAEEELYRLRNVRISEYGLLPFEEAIVVYSPLPPERLLSEDEKTAVVARERSISVSLYPLSLIEYRKNLVPQVFKKISDPILLDRLRIEFASLLNHLISLEPQVPGSPDELVPLVLKAVRYLNLAFERFLGQGEGLLMELLKRHHLITFFRVGVHMVMKIKWEVERWLRSSWYLKKGLDDTFWGEKWGMELKGILKKRPLHYEPAEGDDFREFEWISELKSTLEDINKLMVLDSLMEKLEHSLGPFTVLPERDFRAFLFTPWARAMLRLEIKAEPISETEMREFFSLIRGKATQKPYSTLEKKGEFIRFHLGISMPQSKEAEDLLIDTLDQIYSDFDWEYRWVAPEDLDPRFCPHLLVKR